MKKDVIISIQGQQHYQGYADDPIEFVTDGRYYKKNDRYYISYRESILTGLGNTVTTVKVEPQRVTLFRRGDFPSRFVFEKGKRHVSMYEIDEGALTLALTTKRIKSDLTDDGGDVEVFYHIDMDGEFTGSNLFHIHVKEDLSADSLNVN